MKKRDVIQAAKDKSLNELKRAEANFSTEQAHGDADQALCDLLEALGYHDVVEQYHKVSKWYA